MSISLGHCTDTSSSLVDIDSDHSSSPESEAGHSGPVISSHASVPSLDHHLSVAGHYPIPINNNNVPTKAPFLLPAQLYKSLLASAVLGKTDKMRPLRSTGMPAFPRNLLFSCAQSEQSPRSDTDLDDSSAHEEKAAAAAAFVWSGDSAAGGNQGSGGTPGPGNSPATSCSPAGSHVGHPVHPVHAGHGGLGSVTGAGGQGQNPTQGLVHWMSVMAEHMTTNSHHDPAGVGVHYMWNGGMDQCGQHGKDMDYSGWPAPRNTMNTKQGYEAKMNSSDHQNLNMQKGHLDDGRMDGHHGQVGGMTPSLYGSGVGRSGSSNSSSPAGGPGPGQGSALLVVPQPINASKMGQPGMPNGATGRKYQCKMCPQVRGKRRNKPRDPHDWSPLDHSNPEIFGSKADLQLHTQIHMREAKPYKCSQCSKAFANSSYLSQHTRIHLGIKPYRCEICQRKFTQLSHLQQHIRTHTGDKPYKCRHPGCQKAFSQLSNLQSHSRCHQTDKPYKCNSCYKCFSDEPSLLEHIPKHKESKHLKTHICQYCGKSYTQETYLTKHMQKHAERTDKRPPITGLGLGGLGRNLAMAPGTPLSVTGDHPYWPKVSPDSAASLAEAMSQAQQHDFGQQHVGPGDHQLQSHHRSLMEHHNRMNGEVGEDLVVVRQNSNLGHLGGQNPPAPPSTPIVSSSAYDTSLTKTTTNSAFTPINSMTPHLNSLGHHHQLSQRPYLYDAISFQNKNGNQVPTSNSFPNQLISLHQIRNYAHQPAPGGLMSSEHLLGVGVGVGSSLKDKGQ